jgi:hypothetical protein
MKFASVLSCKFVEAFAAWGGRPGCSAQRPQRTPASASSSHAIVGPDQGVRCGRGRPPHFSYPCSI